MIELMSPDSRSKVFSVLMTDGGIKVKLP